MRTPKPKHSFNRTNQAACRFLKQTQKAIIRLNSLGLPPLTMRKWTSRFIKYLTACR